MRKAIFMDRDGVINKNVKNLSSPKDFVMFPDVPTAIKKINNAGYLVIIVTNQPNISKGFCTFKDLENIHNKMKKLLYKYGAKVDEIYVCPHHPEKGFEGEITELKFDCKCRKPKPGLLLQAIKEQGINPKDSWMIGDSDSDIIAGKSAGCRTVFLTKGGGSGAKHEINLKVKPDKKFKDLREAIEFILR